MKQIERAIEILHLLNKHDRLTVSDIYDKTGLSISYVEQIMSSLVELGFVYGVRGPGGGYTLDVPMVDIKIGDLHKKFTDRTKLKRPSMIFNYVKDVSIDKIKVTA